MVVDIAPPPPAGESLLLTLRYQGGEAAGLWLPESQARALAEERVMLNLRLVLWVSAGILIGGASTYAYFTARN